MLGFDQLIGGLVHGQHAAVGLALAVLRGLRHATDPDHLLAVSTLGAPVVLLGGFLPAVVQDGAELVDGFRGQSSLVR